ncbi:MAG: DUF1810 domain-containing protein [Paludibacteraceae bacterium]|nr:DUF1810 domain-containing protein [Paludibacteraceae bacterium]
MNSFDHFNLSRFVEAQEQSYDIALQEIKQGYKQSHWIWYVFPQIKGLGYSSMAQFYAIQSLDEAKAYLQHPLLRAHLIEITEALLLHSNQSAEQILGYIDAVKVRSSMTLFNFVEPNLLFQRVIDVFYNGIADDKTLRIVSQN